MNFRDEVKHSKEKFLKANCLLRFVIGSIRKFQSTMDAEHLFIIPPSLFDEGKPFTLVDIIYGFIKNSINSLMENTVFQ